VGETGSLINTPSVGASATIGQAVPE